MTADEARAMTALVERRHDPELPIPPRSAATGPINLSTACFATYRGYVCSLVEHKDAHAAYGTGQLLPFVVWTDEAYRRPFLEDIEAQVARATS